jgi:hypothetical protein
VDRGDMLAVCGCWHILYGNWHLGHWQELRLPPILDRK